MRSYLIPLFFLVICPTYIFGMNGAGSEGENPSNNTHLELATSQREALSRIQTSYEKSENTFRRCKVELDKQPNTQFIKITIPEKFDEKTIKKYVSTYTKGDINNASYTPHVDLAGFLKENKERIQNPKKSFYAKYLKASLFASFAFGSIAGYWTPTAIAKAKILFNPLLNFFSKK